MKTPTFAKPELRYTNDHPFFITQDGETHLAADLEGLERTMRADAVKYLGISTLEAVAGLGMRVGRGILQTFDSMHDELYDTKDE